MNKLEEQFLTVIHNYHSNHQITTVDLARFSAKICLEIAKQAYQEGYDDAFHHYQPDFEEFKKDIL